MAIRPWRFVVDSDLDHPRAGLNPYQYLMHVFTQLPKAKTVEDFEALLPDKDQARGLGGGYHQTAELSERPNVSSNGRMFGIQARNSALLKRSHWFSNALTV